MDAEWPLQPRAIMWMNRFIFGVVVVLWIPMVLLGALRGTFVLGRSLPLILTATLGIAYLATFRRLPSWHRLLGIVANGVVVVGTPLAFATSSADERWWGVVLAMAAVALLFGYPLWLLVRTTASAQGEHEARRA